MNRKTAPDDLSKINMTDNAHALQGLPDKNVDMHLEMDHTFPHFDYRCLGVSTIGDTGIAQGKPIEFPADSMYGIEHGQNTAKLAVAFLSYSGPAIDTVDDRRALWTAALFHDIGRNEYLGVPDPDHGMRGALLVEKILRAHPKYWSDERLRERACRLVAHHSTRPSPEGDPVAIALWNADCYEACRYRVGTTDGLMYWKQRRELLIGDRAKETAALRKYMQWRGWKS